MTRLSRLPSVASLAFLLAGSALCEVVDFRGSASIQIDEFRNGTTDSVVEVSDDFPTTDPVLPVQVVGLLLPPIDPNEPNVPVDELAAAAAAAQFDDPTELDQPNPEEFAINMTLNSVSPIIAYRGQARAEEIRTVRFSPEELGSGFEDGDQADLTGRLFVDGALAMLAVDGTRDLTGSNVRLTVQVTQSGGGFTGTVFNGSISLNGAAAGVTDVIATGGFPTDALILSDLGAIDPEFGIFRVLIIPSIAIDYDYSAIVGEDVVLTASVSVDAMNLPNESGVAAVIGTPTDTLDEVIGATSGNAATARIKDSIARERANPSGSFAFPAAQPSGICTLTGFGMMLLLSLACMSTRRR